MFQMNSYKPAVIGPFGRCAGEDIRLEVTTAQDIFVHQLLSQLKPVPPSEIPEHMMKTHSPDLFCDPVMLDEPGHPELLDGSSFPEPLENPNQMLEAEKPKYRNKKKPAKAKPKKNAIKQIKSNKNRSLREEQAENLMKFKENILITEDSGGGSKKYQCKLCEVSFCIGC